MELTQIGALVSGILTVLFLVFNLVFAVISFTECKKSIHKIRYSVLACGSIIGLIFVINVVW
ncbi:hypothetical protein I3900191A7_16000 [Clostridium baratii]|uniref:hypothetical protein n=1 Tax=Clostridium baratii TaxID=1561 RepID=UPI0036F39302